MSFRSSDDMRPTGTTPPLSAPVARPTLTVITGGLQGQEQPDGVRSDLTPKSPLSPGERRALELAADGLSVPDIAAKLGVATKTADAYLSRVRTKLSARNTTHATAIALRFGMIR